MSNNDNEYHFIGIGGIGMSALARILLEKRAKVSGSDLSTTPVTQSLSDYGAQIFCGHSEEYVPSRAVVVYSTDIKEYNPEYQCAIKKNMPMLHRSDLLLELMKGQKTLAIAGTHGKTTTSSLLAAVLEKANYDPSYAIGGLFNPFDQHKGAVVNGHFGKGEYFVAEADESDGTFLKYNSFGAIVTNAEPEHLNYFGTAEAMFASFKTFLENVASSQHLFICGDDLELKRLNSEARGYSYGFSQECDLKISDFRQEGWKIFYTIDFQGQSYKNIEVNLLGIHNALNSAAIFGLSLILGVSESIIRATFRYFHGIERRCQRKGECNGILFLDDYGHHPTEIAATLKGIRAAIEERRLIVLFQPHRYTRVRDCLEEYTHVFDEADMVFVTDIYGARETPIPGISEQSIILNIQKKAKVECRYLPPVEWLESVHAILRPHDVVLTVGAGTITTYGPQLLDYLKTNPPQKLHVGIIKGGKSCEHEVSLKSAEFIIQSLDKNLYEIKDFKITKKGAWIVENQQLADLPKSANSICGKVLDALLECEVLIPVLHGPFGEDGTIQGFFEMIGKTYVGADFRSAAICMDKALTKKIAMQNHIPTPPFVEIGNMQWKKDTQPFIDQILFLKFPVFVKPIHLGSSVGVFKVDTLETLREAIEKAFEYDHMIIVEQGINNCREIEVAVLGNHLSNGYRIEIPSPGEICTGGMVYDYEAKYGQNAMPTALNLDLPQELIQRVQEYASRAYQAIGLNGMARIDFFLDEEGNFWLNEINPIPGFTKNSLYPKVWEAQGVRGETLVNRLIVLALFRKRIQDRLKTDHN